MEQLFDKTVRMEIKSPEMDDRKVAIGITVLLNVVTSPIHKKDLLVRLTDSCDPFFLYSLTLGENDFQGLKSQQGLLVDFSAFPQKFIDLLELCIEEVDNDNPKFLLKLSVSHSDKRVAVLNVVETNPFRHLNHLSLMFVPASDTYLKKYLAECLLGLKEENYRLCDHLTATKTELSTQLSQCKEALSSRSIELESLRAEWKSHTSALSSEHSVGVALEREKGFQAQTDLTLRFDKEKREIEQTYTARLTSAEDIVQELGTANKELTDHKYRSEAAIRELKTKLKCLEDECSGLRQEVQRLRHDNSTLDGSNHEHEKTTSQLRMRVAVLEQEVQNKDQVISRSSELLEAANEQKKSNEAVLEQRQKQITKLETAFKSASQEVMKGNDIIQKLQVELRNIKSKLKLKNMVTTQQEKLIGEKDIAIEREKRELEVHKEAYVKKDEEVRKLESTLKEISLKLEESKEELKTNENVISWLNKQMNDQLLTSGRRGPHTLTPTPAMLSTIRQTPNPLPVSTSAGGTGNVGTLYTQQAQSRPRFSSTPSGPTVQQPTGHTRQALGPLIGQENIRQQVLFRGPGSKPSGVQFPSPLSSHSVSASSIKQFTPPTSAGLLNPKEMLPRPSPVQTDGPWLDPKYFPSQPNPSISADKSSPPAGLKPATLVSSYFPKH